jgi:hypothetical protein
MKTKGTNRAEDRRLARHREAHALKRGVEMSADKGLGRVAKRGYRTCRVVSVDRSI